MSSTYGGTRDTFRETVKDAKDAARESGKAAYEAGGNIQADLDTLRSDVRRLTDQLSEIVASKGTAAWNRARSNIEGLVSDASSKGQDAVDAVREVGDNLADAVNRVVEETALHDACTRGGHRLSLWRHMAPLSAARSLKPLAHGRACHGHPRRSSRRQVVDGRNRSGHDGVSRNELKRWAAGCVRLPSTRSFALA